jgi:UDP-2-acetamido-2-deoxy-ribo-hexuluronate aminotransferase
MTTISRPLQMVDLKTQYDKIQSEIDEAVLNVIRTTMFIGGPEVKGFQDELEAYLEVKHVIPCANGTDALQIAFMALGLQPGDEVIVPAFTFVATAEVIELLKLTPVMVDVDPETFNLTTEIFEAAITPKTKAVVPVHLFGQCADMEGIMNIAEKHGIYVIEDNAQAIGADFNFKDGRRAKAGSIGHIGCTSFFPSKNLGCYGDGGAIFTQDDTLAAKIRVVANHGMTRRYYHDEVGVNSRLDAIQAAVLRIKLRHLDTYNSDRTAAADYYDAAFSQIPGLKTPVRSSFSSHVFHQYTLRMTEGDRDALVQYLNEKQVPCMVYYPVPMHHQEAFKASAKPGLVLPATEQLCKEVFSLPMHSELTPEIQDIIINAVQSYFQQ